MSLNISELMAELAAGEEARKRIPQLEMEVRTAITTADKLAEHNQALELRARDREDTISNLQRELAIVRKDRDDAQFRVMEVEETLTSFRKAVRGFASTILGLGEDVARAEDALNPPKAPEPVAIPEPVVSVQPDPTPTPAATEVSGSVEPISADPSAATSQGRDPGPFVSSTEPQPPIASTTSAEPVPAASMDRNPVTPITAEPGSDFERDRMNRGLDWYDTDGVNHAGRVA